MRSNHLVCSLWFWVQKRKTNGWTWALLDWNLKYLVWQIRVHLMDHLWIMVIVAHLLCIICFLWNKWRKFLSWRKFCLHRSCHCCEFENFKWHFESFFLYNDLDFWIYSSVYSVRFSGCKHSWLWSVWGYWLNGEFKRVLSHNVACHISNDLRWCRVQFHHDEV